MSDKNKTAELFNFKMLEKVPIKDPSNIAECAREVFTQVMTELSKMTTKEEAEFIEQSNRESALEVSGFDEAKYNQGSPDIKKLLLGVTKVLQGMQLLSNHVPDEVDTIYKILTDDTSTPVDEDDFLNALINLAFSVANYSAILASASHDIGVAATYFAKRHGIKIETASLMKFEKPSDVDAEAVVEALRNALKDKEFVAMMSEDPIAEAK